MFCFGKQTILFNFGHRGYLFSEGIIPIGIMFLTGLFQNSLIGAIKNQIIV